MTKVRLDTITNLAVVATCVGMLAFMAQSHLARQGAATMQEGYSVGEKIESIAGVRFDRAERTLLVAISQTCRYCEESLPFYRALTTAVRNAGLSERVQIVVITRDEQTSAVEHMRKNEVPVNGVASLTGEEMRALKVLGTPTLILTNRTGVVEDVWIGKLGPKQEQKVLEKIVRS